MKELFRRLLGEDPKGEPIETRIARIEQQARTATEKIAAAAERDIQRAWTQYDRIWKLAMISATIVTAVALFFGFRTYSDFQNQIRQVNESAQVEANKVRTEVVAELNRQFARPEIEALIIEKAKERIDITAEPLIASMLSNRLSVVLTDLQTATNSLAAINQQIMDAEKSLEQLKAGSDFVLTVLNANNDDGAAYDQLAEIAADSESLFSSIALLAYANIMYQSAVMPESISKAQVLTDLGRSTNASLEEIRGAFDELAQFESASLNADPPVYRAKLLYELLGRGDISKADKLHFAMYAYTNDTSLRVRRFAGNMLNKEPGADYLPLASERLLAWWRANSTNYPTTNALFSVPESSGN
jgi:hypothetical protein